MFEKVALIGGTGAVGRIVLRLLEEREISCKDYKFLASSRSAGTSLHFKGDDHTVEELTDSAFRDCDIVISTTPDDMAAKYLTCGGSRRCSGDR